MPFELTGNPVADFLIVSAIAGVVGGFAHSASGQVVRWLWAGLVAFFKWFGSISVDFNLNIFFGLILISASVLSAVLLLRSGLDVGISGPLAASLAWYNALVSVSFGWFEPVINPILVSVSQWLGWTLHLSPSWKHVFILLLLYFGAVTRAALVTQLTSGMFVLVWGGMVALVTSVIATSNLRYNASFEDTPFVMVIAAGVATFHVGVAAWMRVFHAPSDGWARSLLVPSTRVILDVITSLVGLGVIVLLAAGLEMVRF